MFMWPLPGVSMLPQMGAGLSTLELLRSFPGARLVGLDLSPHFLAVARHLQRRREAAAGGTLEPIRWGEASLFSCTSLR
jgi:trans-aconitate methyltransferase